MSTTKNNDYPNWPSIYSEILKVADIPGTSSDVQEADEWVIRDMYVSLADVYANIRKVGANPMALIIYADVVHIPKNFSWNLVNAAMVITARRVEIVDSAEVMLDYRSTKMASLIIYTNEFVGDLHAVAITSEKPTDPPTVFSVGPLTSIGAAITYLDDAPVRRALDDLQSEMLEEGSTFDLSLVSIFQFATVLFSTKPDIASSMLQWIKKATAQSEVFGDMFLQSSSLLALLQASTGGITFVPYLSQSLYAKLSAAFVAAAQNYEQEYQRFQDKNEEIEARQQSAKLMLDHYKDTEDFASQLVKQTIANLDSAVDAVSSAEIRLHAQQNKVAIAKITLEYGIKDWEYQQKLKAAFDIITAVLTFAATIAAVCTGDEAAAGGAATAPTRVASAAASTTKVVKVEKTIGGVGASSLARNAASSSTLNKIGVKFNALGAKVDRGSGLAVQKASAAASRVAAASPKLSVSMNDVTKVSESMRRVWQFAMAISQVSENLVDTKSVQGLLKEIQDSQISGGADIAALADWTTFKLEADSHLATAINFDINGARDYKLQLDILVVYAKAYLAAQVSAIKISQELVRLTMQENVSEKQVARLNNYISTLSADELPNDAMMQMFYQRYLNVKRSFFVAIENYNWAYKYWALRDSGFTPSITEKVSRLQTDLANIEQDYVQALQAFDPPPQQFSNKTCIITDPSVLKSLSSTHTASWPVQLDDATFLGFDRVRVNTVQIYLDGAKPKGSTPIYLLITNSGIYHDRFKGETFQFTSAPLQRGFQYQIEGGEVEVLLDGKVSDEEEYAYFVPTAFSDWEIFLPSDENVGLDLSAVTQIRMEFSGSAIAELAS